MFMKTNWKTAALAAAMAIGLGVSGAAASTVIMFGEGSGPSGISAENERGQITCSLGCDGWWLGDDVEWINLGGPPGAPDWQWDKPQSDGDWDPARALMLVGPDNSDVASYEAWFEGVLGFPAPDPVMKTNVGPDSHTFTTDAAYFTLSLGSEPRVALFRSYWQGNVISYTNTGTGSGLSHIVEYGLAPIPLPAAGWLLLTALGGLGAAGLRRRRKDA